jgi:rfaE bifunctional protein kinase chain/domain
MEKKILISGIFNVIHPGHLRLIRYARNLGSKLIVAIESDRLAGKNAHVSQNLRIEAVQSISLVDESFIFEDSIQKVIEIIKPDYVVKGKEYEKVYNPEQESVNKYGGELVFSSGETIFSSIDLINKEYKTNNKNIILLPEEYMSRHKIKKDNLVEIIEKFSTLNICVIGDVIVDEYITCDPLGMSQEDPTIVVTPVDTKKFIGGAGIVSAHAAAMGANVSFFTVTGSDESRDLVESYLKKFKVNAKLYADNTRLTTLKKRYRAKGKTLLRVSHLNQNTITIEMQNKIIIDINKIINKIDLLVFSDFNYGCLPQSLVDKLTEMCKQNNVVLAADSQSSSQFGDISRFKNMDLITPTEREARISTRNKEDGLIVMAEELMNNSKTKHLLLKLGEEGLIVHTKDKRKYEWNTDKLNALNLSPKDVAGAGDSMLITSAMALSTGSNIWEAACLGSIAAAVQVSRVGNSPITKEEIIKEIK